jgi:predicted phage terminase large subunit-like protein
MVAQLAPEQINELLDLDAIRTTLAEKSLRHFVRQAWHVVEPGTAYQHNWHIDALCDHLEATLDGRIRNLLINIPPRSMKTLIVSVFFPAWAWIQRPELRFLYASYAQRVSEERSVSCRTVIESGWYQDRWGNRVHIADDDNGKQRFGNTRRGYCLATSVGGAVTAFGADILVADDPHNVQQAESEAVREAAVRWWNRSMSTRLNNPKTGIRIVVMQRVHEDDVAGSVLKRGTYTHLNIPMEYEPTDYVSPLGWQDPRTDLGELMWPDRFDAEKIAEYKAELGSYGYASQMQQRPTPLAGGILKHHWFRFWQYRGTNLPPVEVIDGDGRCIAHPVIDLPGFFDDQLQSWDLSFKETRSGSYVVGLVGGVLGAHCYLLDRYRERTDFPGTVAAFLEMTHRYPNAVTKLVEDKANGPALMDTLRSKVPGIVAVSPDGTKEARMHAASPFIEGGGLVLPHPRIAPWVEEYIAELTTFPFGVHDDQADATSQLIRRVAARQGSSMQDVVAAMMAELGGFS